MSIHPLRPVAFRLLALVGVLAFPASAAAQAFLQEARLTASDAASVDKFGECLALEGDTLVVGAPLEDDGVASNTGAVYVYTLSGTTWSEQAKLLPSDVGTPGQSTFGRSLALSGDTLLVGSFGAAYVFVRSGTTWSEQVRLTPSQGEDLFGGCVALEGDTAVVGLTEDIFPLVGSAYVFIRSGTSWSEQARLVGSDTQPEDNFGASVALSGSTVLVGSHFDSLAAPELYEGSAYVFLRSGTTWSEQAKLVASDAGEGNLFGFSAALEGDTAVIGARGDGPGSAYVFTRSGTLWTQRAKLQASDGEFQDEFGFSVSLHGDTLVVGAWAANVVGGKHGSAYVYWNDGTSWVEAAKLFADDASSGDLFGVDVVTTGDRVAVGAPGADAPGLPDAGAAYVFTAEPGPNLTSVTPATIEALIPGTAQTIQLAGRSLDLTTSLTLDGAVVDPARYTIVSPELVTLDMPQASGLGTHELAVTNGSVTDRFAVTVVAAAQPRYELGTGEPLNVIDRENGLRFLLGGPVGKPQWVYVSSSDVPSTSRFVSLAIGNNFTDLCMGGQFVIPSSGWLQVDVPPSALGDPGALGQVFYSQTVQFTFPKPLPVSNLQSIVLVQ